VSDLVASSVITIALPRDIGPSFGTVRGSTAAASIQILANCRNIRIYFDSSPDFLLYRTLYSTIIQSTIPQIPDALTSMASSPRDSPYSHPIATPHRPGRVSSACSQATASLGSGEPRSPSPAGLISGARIEATPHRCRDSRESGDAFETLRLGILCRRRSSGNHHPLASGGLASILDVQDQGWATAYSSRAAPTYPTDGR
jgi:hypothetical protein